MYSIARAFVLGSIAVMCATGASAQPALHVTAPGCTSAAAIAEVHGSLLVDGGTVVCRFDAADLALTQTIPLPGPAASFGLLVEASGDDFVSARNGVVHIIDGATGAVLHTLSEPTPTVNGGFGAALAVGGGRVLVGNIGDNEVHAFDEATGAFLYTVTENEIFFGHAVAVLESSVLVSGLPGMIPASTRIHRYDLATGASLGVFATVLGGPLNGGDFLGNLTVTGDDLLVGLPGSTNPGAVHLLDGGTGATIRTFVPPPDGLSLFARSVRTTASEVFVLGSGPSRRSTYIFDLASGDLLRTVREQGTQLAVLADRTITGPEVYAICGGTTGCAPCETCGPLGSCVVAPHPTCQHLAIPGAVKLTVADAPPSGPPKGSVLWSGGGDFAPGPPLIGPLFGVPTVDTDIALCLFDGASALAFRAVAPADDTCGARPCWTPRGGGSSPQAGYSYRDRDATPDGIGSLRLLRRSNMGRVTLKLSSTGSNLFARPFGMPALPLVTPVTAQLQMRDGQCIDTVHSNPTTNGEFRFSARSD